MKLVDMRPLASDFHREHLPRAWLKAVRVRVPPSAPIPSSAGIKNTLQGKFYAALSNL